MELKPLIVTVFYLVLVWVLFIIIHQIFLLAHNWSKIVMRLNTPQLKLGNIPSE